MFRSILIFSALIIGFSAAHAESIRIPLFEDTFFSPYEAYAGSQVVYSKKSGKAGVSFAFRRDHFFFNQPGFHQPDFYRGDLYSPSYRYEEVVVPEFSYDNNTKTVTFSDGKGFSTLCAVQKGKFLNKRMELTPACHLEEKLTRLDHQDSPFSNGHWSIKVDLLVDQ